MTERKAKREACDVTARLIDQYLDAGQPHADCIDGKTRHRRIRPNDCHPGACPDCDRLVEGFTAIRNELERRS